MSMPMLRPLAVALLALFFAADAGARAASADHGGRAAGQTRLLAQAEPDAARPWLGVGLTGGPDAANTGVPIRAVAD
ncbi:MAG: hypothetical protein IRY94_20950, partial [Rhodospirillaceae bacterium]|nr:hypothetical protein [Rhodospirillaceae bacterium]